MVGQEAGHWDVSSLRREPSEPGRDRSRGSRSAGASIGCQLGTLKVAQVRPSGETQPASVHSGDLAPVGADEVEPTVGCAKRRGTHHPDSKTPGEPLCSGRPDVERPSHRRPSGRSRPGGGRSETRWSIRRARRANVPLSSGNLPVSVVIALERPVDAHDLDVCHRSARPVEQDRSSIGGPADAGGEGSRRDLTTRRSFDPSGSMSRRSAATSVLRQKAMDSPSGENRPSSPRFAATPSAVSGIASVRVHDEEVAGAVDDPPEHDAFPSGDQSGFTSAAGSLVRRTRPVRSRFIR